MVVGSLGLFVGLVLGLTGAGSAIIAVPLLIFALNWDVARSAPVALVAVSASTTFGTALGLRQGCVRYRAALVMAAAGAAMTPFALLVAQRLPVALPSSLFAFVLLYVAWRVYYHARQPTRGARAAGVPRGAPCKRNALTGRFAWTAQCTRALVFSGLVTGALSGLLGVGGGFVVVPALRKATDLPMNSIVATSLMVVALISTFAVVASVATRQFEFAVSRPFATGALAGMFIARGLAPKIAARNYNRVLRCSQPLWQSV